ncbi:MAG: polyphosphate polymerase domain-containing protein [Anaerolineales bacterium]|nr:polyphosphate polymerase domain-containing protein [Anaerolineales bacterium]
MNTVKTELGRTKSYNIERIINRFDPINLKDLKQYALLDRTDTKYVMSLPQLCRALEGISADYRILDIDGTRLNHYQTLYFDTASFDLYRHHHNGGRNRYKLRYRQYMDSDLCYLEVKFKDNKQRTIKSRKQVPQVETSFSGSAADFIRKHSPYEPDEVDPAIWNQFYRMTLVSKKRLERLTIDLNVHFFHQNQVQTWPGVVIAEVKQPKFSVNSDFVRMMRSESVQPRSFSKYCMGVSQLCENVPTNNFKPNLLLMQRLTQGGDYRDRVN